MAKVEKSIDVNAPIDAVYNQWTQFEEYPRFMEGVQEVHQIDDARLTWTAEVGGRRKEWYAKIIRQVPDEVIAWESEGGVMNNGVVTFHRKGPDRTEVDLAMEYEPEDFVEQVGDKLGFMGRQVQGDLERFKEFIEARGQETGGWRGTIQGGEPQRGSGTMMGGQGSTSYPDQPMERSTGMEGNPGQYPQSGQGPGTYGRS